MANPTGIGGFKRGQGSANPGGRPKMTMEEREFIDKCRALAPQMLDIVVAIANDESAKRSDRLAAANSVLNRGYVQRTKTELTGAGDQPLIPQLIVTVKDKPE